MSESFRGLLDRLRQAGELVDIHQPVDIRHIATLVNQAKTALLFHKVNGYAIPVLSGLIMTRERALLAQGCESFLELEEKVKRGLDHPIPPVTVAFSPDHEVVAAGNDVDMYRLPIPICSVFDGGPMITAGIVIANDPEFGLNTGIYRFLVRERNVTGIDIVTPNDLRQLADRAFKLGKPLPISINIGTHPVDLMGTAYRAAPGVNEMGICGGMRGEAVTLAPCNTVDVPFMVDAEIVLEAEILPTGWVWPEGRFGEFTQLMGGLHWNPLVRIKAIVARKNPIFYSLHMPWECIWLAVATRYMAIRQAMLNAGVLVKNINVTEGGSGYWYAVISIRKRPGEGQNALLAALSVMDLKHVVIVDDDIDVYNPTDVEWALCTRVQADRDVLIIKNARAKPLDPSLAPVPAGSVPTGAKLGIDATKPENVPAERYDRITYAYAETAKIADYLAGKQDMPGEDGDDAVAARLAIEIAAVIEQQPLYCTALAERFSAYNFPLVARALGVLHAEQKLWQDPVGRICLRDSKFAAVRV